MLGSAPRMRGQFVALALAVGVTMSAANRPVLAQQCHGCNAPGCFAECFVLNIDLWDEQCLCSCGWGGGVFWCVYGECLGFAGEIVFGGGVNCDNPMVCSWGEYLLPRCSPIWV